MKFGLQLYDRATAKWRNYNIDYNELKTAIKNATSDVEIYGTCSSSSSDSDATARQPNAHVQKRERDLLRAMYRAFQEQIDFVSLFVDSKIGEIQRRLVSLKRQCNLLIKQSQSEALNSLVLQRVTNRKLETYKKELEVISRDLQDLSRFILLQKIAIRKLFKKFLKHSQYPQKQQLIDKMTKQFLIDNPKAFTNANLKDLSTEMSLLSEFLHSFNKNSFDNHIEDDRRLSIHTLDSLKIPTKEYRVSPCNPLASRIATFDIISRKKGPRTLTFWVHEDNLDEIKFYLSAEFKLITDESFLVEERELSNQNQSSVRGRRGSGVKLRETKSTLHLNKEMDPKYNARKDDFIPESETINIWLNNSQCPIMTNSSTSKVDEVDNETPIFQADPSPHICLSTSALETAVLFTPVGGLRQFTVAPVNQELIKYLFINQTEDKSQFKKQVFKEYTKYNLVGNPSMAELSFDWVIDHGVKPLAKVKSHRLRYITTNSIGDKITSYISLDWGIKTTNDDVYELKKEDVNQIDFKHAILNIHFGSNITDLPKSVQKLVSSHLVYQVDQLNFSLNNYLAWNYANQHISDSAILKYIVPWFEIYDNQDIRKIPSIESPEPEGGILLNKNDVQLPKTGYWNEFDDGSDFGDDNNGFYIDNEDVDDDLLAADNGPGLGWISNTTMEKLLSCSNTLTKWVYLIQNGGKYKERESLLTPAERHYSIYDNDSDDESNHPKGYRAINSLETIRYVNHDRVISFIYMSCLVLAYILSGIGVGLVMGLFQYDSSIQLTWMGITVIGIAILALLISVLLSVAGVCLSMCRYQHAPLWHYVFIWSGVFFTSVALIFGLTLLI